MIQFKIDDHIGEARTVAISGHIRPDGDCIGSCMGMYHYLKKAYPALRVDVFLEEVPASFAYIKEIERVNTTYETDVDVYDLFICLDSVKDRIGKAEAIFDKARHTVNIDHHVSNQGTGEINYIVPEASSACELVYRAINHELIDETIAVPIYTGMVTDTGVFKYSSTSKETMEIAGDLITYGFDFPHLIDSVFYEKTFVQQRLMGEALAGAELYFDGACIAAYLPLTRIEELQAASSDLEGIASQMKLTKGVHCSLFVYGLPDGDNKISLRSDGCVNVSEIAQTIPGGGGHARAAGCNIAGSYEDVLAQMLPKIEAQLKKCTTD